MLAAALLLVPGTALAMPGTAFETSGTALATPVAGGWVANATASLATAGAAADAATDGAAANDATPTSQKSATPVARYVVLESSDEQWHAVADWPQETDIPFLLTGTLPADLASRTGYDYWLVAEPGEGLAYVEGTARVTLTREDGTTQDVTGALSVGGTDHQVWAGSDDIRSAVPGIAATDTLTLAYSARLTAAAQRGFERGNESWAHIEYEPQGGVSQGAMAHARPVFWLARAVAALAAPEAAGPRAADLTRSPELQTIVYTYRLVVCKVGEDGRSLAGATFALRDASGLWYADGNDWTEDRSKAATRTTGADGTAIFDQVDSERYDAVELSAPAGYAVVDPVDVTLQASASSGHPTLAASSSRGSVRGTNAQDGTVELEVADPLAASPRLRLSRTGDATRHAWPLLALSVLALLGGVLLRRRGGLDTHGTPIPDSGGGVNTTERMHHGTN